MIPASHRFRATAGALMLLGGGFAAQGALAGGTVLPKLAIEPVQSSQVTVPAAAKRSCASRLLGERRGVVTRKWTAAQTGFVTFHLRGTGRNDWDLGLFGPDRKLLRGSQAFRANEVVQVGVRSGTQLTLQICRRTGSQRTMVLDTGFVGIPLATAAIAPVKQSKVRISYADSRTAMPALQKLGIDLGEDVRRTSVDAILHGADDGELLDKAGFRYVTEIADLAAHDRRERAKDRAYARRMGAKGSPIPSGRTGYRMYEDYQAELKSLAEKNPELVRPITLKNKTFQGRDLQAIEIADKVARKDDGRPYFILNAMHHAREWPAAETPMELAYLLINDFGKDRRITKLLKGTRVIVMPLTNADGFISSRTFPLDPDPDGSSELALFNTVGAVGLGPYRRKNCNGLIPVGLVPCELQTGTDNNRNYGQDWGGAGASSSPLEQTYRGAAPFSDPETLAVRELVSAYQGTMFITMHNVAALVLRPPGVKSAGLAPDEARLKSIGDAMGRATGYTSQYGWELYDTTGTTDDWSYPATGGFGYTIEVGPSGGEFHANYKDGVVDQWTGDYLKKTSGKGLREAFLIAAENARNPTDVSRLRLVAPAGRTIRIQKEFETESSEVCAVADPAILVARCDAPGERIRTPEKLTSSVEMPKSGRLTWWVNPSTRPFARRAGKVEAWKLTCEDGGKVLESKDVVVDRGKVTTVRLRCR